MTYVLIHGRGLMGLGLGDASEGAPLDIPRVSGTAGNGPRGPVGGRSIGVRAFHRTDAGLPPSALGAVEVVDVRDELNRLVAAAQEETQRIVETSGLLSRAVGGPQTWAASVVGLAQSVRATMLAVRNGQPFFAREPEAAARIMSTAARDVERMTQEFAVNTSTLVPGTFFESIDMIIERIVAGLVHVADKAFRAAVAKAGELPPLPSGLPGWLAPLAAVVGLVVVAKVVL